MNNVREPANFTHQAYWPDVFGANDILPNSGVVWGSDTWVMPANYAIKNTTNVRNVSRTLSIAKSRSSLPSPPLSIKLADVTGVEEHLFEQFYAIKVAHRIAVNDLKRMSAENPEQGNQSISSATKVYCDLVSNEYINTFNIITARSFFKTTDRKMSTIKYTNRLR